MENNEGIECAKCAKIVCHTRHSDQGTENCPTRKKRGLTKKVLEIYSEPATREFALKASIQEYECYLDLPEGRTTRFPRAEEIIQFARKMRYRKLGMAFCGGLKEEASIFNEMLENRGFQVFSVCCKVGGVAKEEIGIKKEKIAGPDAWETMCNPILQANILNEAGTDFNILVGLCVGHDSLFFKYAVAPTTVLLAKDRVFGHNPAVALYLSKSYYRKLMRKETNV